MAYHPPANREYELDLFKRMVNGQIGQRILLLEAEGEMGKTTLLREFIRRRPAHVRYASVDFKDNTLGIHQFFYRLCDKLCDKPEWEHFPLFTAEIAGLNRINITGNTIIGRADIDIALRTPDEGDRQARLAALSRAFFSDIRTWGQPLLLIFDTFEEASPEVQDWFQGDFLAFAGRTPGLTIIVAGRKVPAENIEWADHCFPHRLSPIDDPQYWQRFCRASCQSIHEEWIKAYCALFKGHPHQIVQALAAVTGPGGRP